MRFLLINDYHEINIECPVRFISDKTQLYLLAHFEFACDKLKLKDDVFKIYTPKKYKSIEYELIGRYKHYDKYLNIDMDYIRRII